MRLHGATFQKAVSSYSLQEETEVSMRHTFNTQFSGIRESRMEFWKCCFKGRLNDGFAEENFDTESLSELYNMTDTGGSHFPKVASPVSHCYECLQIIQNSKWNPRQDISF
jgi:hypothetical protein